MDAFLGDTLEEGEAVNRLLMDAAEVYDVHLQDRAKAQAYFERLVQASAYEPNAVAMYEAALNRWEAFEDLRNLLDEQATATVDAELRVSLLKRSAELSEVRLGSADDALSRYREALDVEPSDAPAAAAIERLLSQEERWAALADHLYWMQEQAEDADKSAIAARLAKVQTDCLTDIPAAVDLYAQMLERNGEDQVAVSELEILLERDLETEAVANLLEPVYRASAEDEGVARDKLIGILKVSLGHSQDAETRAERLDEISEWEARAGRAEASFAARADAWVERGTHIEDLTALTEEVASAGGLEEAWLPRFAGRGPTLWIPRTRWLWARRWPGCWKTYRGFCRCSRRVAQGYRGRAHGRGRLRGP